MKLLASSLVIALMLTQALAIEPADKDLIPEARQLLSYLESVYGKKTIAALNGAKNVDGIKQASGKEPAIVGFDLSGWNSPAWGDSYNKVVQHTLEDVKAWHARGGIVTMQCHWINPSNPQGSAWKEKHGNKQPSPPYDFASALQPGTAANAELMRDLKNHADFLEQLTKARIPVLWRPCHEIDGGWFWWTDTAKPENTAALWKCMFNYFVKERKLHNLIWVYSAGVRCGKGKEGYTNVEQRKRFYPGAEYVDIAGIDVYPSPSTGIGKPQTDTYAMSFNAMKQVAPGKLLALCECEAIPNPDQLAKGGPPWLYALPWWGIGKLHPADWAKQCYGHEHLTTLDQLPKWRSEKH